ncbi:MAG: Peptide methionine sulfoxide reductase MsrB [Oceanospirillaceae bacterium UBA2001]|nr:MAG: Peptide methionine sulfoxide reductase MsrB [Oceanospirillaceae bacterium UBA2001]
MADNHNSKSGPAKTEAQWQKELSPEAFAVCRQKGTERPYTGAYDQHFENGHYHCHCCGAELFSSQSKFDAGCGWPSFSAPTHGPAIKEEVDISSGMRRTEVMCDDCGAHLGHVFPDGPPVTGLRYCINSVALDFKKA